MLEWLYCEQGSPTSLVRTLPNAGDHTNPHKPILVAKSRTLPLIPQLCRKVHEYFIEYNPIIYTKISWYSPILMFHSQINICHQQTQNVDHVPLKIREKRILLAELLGFSLCEIAIMEDTLTPCSKW